MRWHRWSLVAFVTSAGLSGCAHSPIDISLPDPTSPTYVSLPRPDDTSTTVAMPRPVCVASSEPDAAPTTAGPDRLVMRVEGAEYCGADQSGIVTVTNHGETTCTGDIMATLGSGTRMWFQSTSGYGGATGSWLPVPERVVDGVGVMEYPPGDRSWPIVLPAGASGADELTIAITCDGRPIALAAGFTTEPG